MAHDANTKVCKVCGKELPIDQFRPNPKCKDGHLDTCYDCLNGKIKKGKEKTPKKETMEFDKQLEMLDFLMETSDQELVNELRSRGYDVTCTKTISL